MTYILIIATALTSVLAFRNKAIFDKYKFNPYVTMRHKEWYRLLSHGFLHANTMHLLINMVVLWSFGLALEKWLKAFERYGMLQYALLWYVLFYLVAIVVASLTTLYKHRDHSYYNSVGASGAVSAVVFAVIFLDPMNPVYLFFIPIPIPGIVFALAYLFYSYYMSRRESDNINHDAHFVGAVFGFLFPLLIDFSLLQMFVNQLFG